MAAVTPELREVLQGGFSTVLATADERRRPTISRGWGTVVSGDEVRVCAADPTGRVRADLAAGGAVAMTTGNPQTYRGVQVKGSVVAHGEPEDADLERARAHAEAMADGLRAVGVRAVAERLIGDVPLVAVSFRVLEVFDQTPGPKAGARL